MLHILESEHPDVRVIGRADPDGALPSAVLALPRHRLGDL